MTKAGTTGASVFSSGVTFNVTGTGTVAVNSGELSIQGGGTDSTASPMTIAAAATLDFGGGTYTIAASSGISGVGSGVASFSGATVNDAGSYSVTGTTVIPGGTANLTGSIASVGATVSIPGGTLNLSGTGSAPLPTTTLTLSGGTLTGSNTLTVTGATTWNGGTMSGSGVTNAEGGLTLGMATGGGNFGDFLTQRTLNNAGSAVIERTPTGSYTYLYLSSGALFDNQPGASFAFANDSTYVQSNGGTPAGGTFLDEGSVTKAGTTGASVFSSGVTLNVTGTGTVAVNSDELSIQGGGTDSTASPMTIAAAATLDFGGGTYTFAASSGISGVGAGLASFSGGTVNDAGSFNVAGTTVIPGGTLNYSGAAAATTGALNLDGGTLTGPSVFTVTGATTWNGGTMSGSGVTNAEGGLALGGTDASSYYSMILDQRTFHNAGAALFQRSASGGGYYSILYLSSGATFDNQAAASFDFTDDNL